MKTVIQRVNYCKVVVAEKVVSSINKGILILIGIEKSDTFDMVNRYSEKILKLGIFKNSNGKLGRTILEEKCDIMIISQITLIANLNKGKKPDFSNSATVDNAKRLYSHFVDIFKKTGLNVKTGEFGEYMKVELENDGPVTFII
ncbi:D-tyrosyl-tRNA(Tyr) deacylase [candidate division WOR-3 bacterium]|nr:D-tyrosyl-tRNA(Tyr) deacylase [candidate division WOR-3 bacterium]